LAGLIDAGRLADAFSLFQQRMQEGAPPAASVSWALAQELRQAGMLDPAFAVSRELALGGHGPAALAIAEMYDPRGWRADGSPFSKPNAAKAAEWYERAAAAGVSGAAAEAAALRRSVETE
jgi:serine/threonine-protein kinase